MKEIVVAPANSVNKYFVLNNILWFYTTMLTLASFLTGLVVGLTGVGCMPDRLDRALKYYLYLQYIKFAFTFPFIIIFDNLREALKSSEIQRIPKMACQAVRRL